MELFKAVHAGQLETVKEMMRNINLDGLLKRTNAEYTVLALAVEVGNKDIAECLIAKNKELLGVDKEKKPFDDRPEKNLLRTDHWCFRIPVIHSVLCSHFEMASFLYDETGQAFLATNDDGKTGAFLIAHCISRNSFDIPLRLLEYHPKLATTVFENVGEDQKRTSAISALAHCSKSIFHSNRISAPDFGVDHIAIGVLNRATANCSGSNIINNVEEVHNEYHELLNHICGQIKHLSNATQVNPEIHKAILIAVENGNVQYIKKIVEANPELVWTNDLALEVFKHAIKFRQAEVFSLLYGLLDKRATASRVDGDKNSMLHMVASIPSSKILNLIPGAALQMQRELQWFKEVEAIVTPVYHQFENQLGERPQGIFTESHKDLVIAGEKWMKDTSSSCTVVGALIITIMFAVAFTVPGGNDQETGFPLLADKMLFKVFIISDVMSLFSSVTSTLMFLGILTSRYAEEDFLKSLPTKMIIGLSTLFLSIAAMMVAFCAALFMILHQKWIAFLISALAIVPVTLFAWIQFPLLVDIYYFTYGPSIFDRKVKPWLYANDQN